MQNSFCRRTAQFWCFYLKPTQPREFQNLFSETFESFLFSCTEFFIGEIKLKIWTLNLCFIEFTHVFSKISNFLMLVLVPVFICNCISLYAQNFYGFKFLFQCISTDKFAIFAAIYSINWCNFCHIIKSINAYLYYIIYDELLLFEIKQFHLIEWDTVLNTTVLKRISSEWAPSLKGHIEMTKKSNGKFLGIPPSPLLAGLWGLRPPR